MSMFNFKPISTALLPNAEKDDIFLILKLILPWNWSKWREGKEINELEGKFKEYFDVKQAISFSSSRVGLYAILKSLSDIQNSKFKIQNFEIILQAYTTIALPLAIKKAGFIPVYVDIKEDTYNIDAEKIETKITVKTKAIIVQHTFGIPAEMDKILALCKKYNLILIEDCAHALGAEFSGKKIGTFGDAAFFSFGRDKIISSTSGGMVIVKNEKLAEKIKELQNSLNFPSLSWIFQQLMHPLVFWFFLPIYYFLNFGKYLIFLAQKLELITRAYSQEEKRGNVNSPREIISPLAKFPPSGISRGRLPNVLAILALNQFKKLERFNDHRRKIAEIYQNELCFDSPNIQSKIKLPLIEYQSKPTFLYYTIQVDQRDELLKFAAGKHIILGDWFPGALGPKGVDEKKFDYIKGSCPVSERVGLRSINLPTNIKTSEADARKVIGVIKEFLNKKNT